MALRKVTYFDHNGLGLRPTDDDGQAKPCALGVRWVNPDTLETIYLRPGRRTGPKGETLQEVAPSLQIVPPDGGDKVC
ncbi:MAG TPA: hypothetical protein VKV28_08130 [Candidatus Binataceae bacterium]|nr:hypothetical protein [Candidatus Binataceae bacterium]